MDIALATKSPESFTGRIETAAVDLSLRSEPIVHVEADITQAVLEDIGTDLVVMLEEYVAGRWTFVASVRYLGGKRPLRSGQTEHAMPGLAMRKSQHSRNVRCAVLSETTVVAGAKVGVRTTPIEA